MGMLRNDRRSPQSRTLTSPPSPRSSPVRGEERGGWRWACSVMFQFTSIPAPLPVSPRWGEETPSSQPPRYALPTCHAASGRAASDPCGAVPVARASSLRGGILSIAGMGWLWPPIRRHEPGIIKRLCTGSAFMPDRLDDRNDHIRFLRDQDGERRTTRWIVSTAGAAAWLPHSKPRDTGNVGRHRYLH